MKPNFPVVISLALSLPAALAQGTTKAASTSTATATGATLTNPSEAQEKAAILSALEEQQRAMIAGDLKALDAVLDEVFTAVHITGYRQPKAEWLAQIRAGQFDYHSARRQGTTITVNGNAATAVGRSVVDVTIGGSRGTWRLESTAQLAKKNGQWKIMTSRSTTY